ncbi:MAG: hypothetical protein Q8P35_00255 [Candidatus Yanofskybacteria bacterium]|nr:hypothetical protein [Candidatus Yanofskybacteria bacterium]
MAEISLKPGQNLKPIHPINPADNEQNPAPQKPLIGIAIALVLIIAIASIPALRRPVKRFFAGRPNVTNTPMRTQSSEPTKTATPSRTLATTPASGQILFRSGFDGNFAINNFIVKFALSSQWQARIAGTDTSTGAVWPDDLPGNSQDAKFDYHVSSNNNLDDYIETRIEEVIGPHGTRTKALYQEVKKDDPKIFRTVTRNMFTIAPEAGKDFEEGYSKYWIKFQPNFKDLYADQLHAWRNVMEWRETDNQYRIVVSIEKRNERYHWRVAGESDYQFRPGMEKYGSWYVDWSEDNFSAPIPITVEWFLLETSFKRHPSNGTLSVSVNGQSVVSHTGRTMFDGPLASWHVFKAYTKEEAFKKGPVYQWIDDVYICTGSGCGF